MVPSVVSSKADGVDIDRRVASFSATDGCLVRSSPRLDSQGGLEVRNDDIFIEVSVELGVLGDEPLVVTIEQVELADGVVILGGGADSREETSAMITKGSFKRNVVHQMAQKLLIKGDTVGILAIICGSVGDGEIDFAIRDGGELGDTVHDINSGVGVSIKSKNTLSMSIIGNADGGADRVIIEDIDVGVMVNKLVDGFDSSW